MSHKTSELPRILAISVSTRGIGFAVLERREILVNWGVKEAEGNKNKICLLRVKELIAQYQPNLIVLEDTSAEGSKRSVRTKALTKRIVTLVSRNKIKTVLFSKEQIRKAFFADGKGTKQEIAEMIAKRFPEELAHWLPPKRRAWDKENHRMGIFDAVALAVMCRVNSSRIGPSPKR